MATLLQHMRPWMHRSIEKCEAKMEQMMDQKIHAINKRLDTFDLRVLERPTPTIDVTPFQTELVSLYTNVTALLAPTQTASEAIPKMEEDHVVMTALFGYAMPPPYSFYAAGKRHRSDHTSDTNEARRLKKKERQ
ncbi:hypothetical protein R3W88_024622 [Solanum pinnatisectum]|uniref:Integrase core domain containing protein n=1 Tax=Solanum pinnatisectum TaxID=50273 RepID=A0AAV9M134_9SOLN|nr:hypothetical protein R3W88_024622 [Solanum pinnatisectum]